MSGRELDRVQRRHAVACARHDAQLRPERVQQFGQLVGQQRLVLGEDGGRGGGRGGGRVAPVHGVRFRRVHRATSRWRCAVAASDDQLGRAP